MDTLVFWIKWCVSTIAYFGTVVGGVAEEWYRDIGNVFMRLAEERTGGK